MTAHRILLTTILEGLLLTAAPLVAAQPPVRFVGVDRATHLDYTKHYGILGTHIYPDGGTVTFPVFARGVGTQMRWPTFPGKGVGLYNRTADGVPMRMGFTITTPVRLRFRLCDFDAGTFTAHRTERIDVYQQSTIQVTEPGSLGQPFANGPLLDSQVIADFEQCVYPGWDVRAPVIFQFTAIEPHLYANGSPILDTNGLAVESGVMVDQVGSCVLEPATPTVEATPLPVGTAYTIRANHDGFNCLAEPTTLISARCLFDTTLSVPATISVRPYLIECVGPLLPPGPHSVEVGVSNAVGESFSRVHQFTVSAPVPPAGFCRYIKPGSTVVQTLALGTVVMGTNQIATQAVRWPILLGWGFKILAEPLSSTAVYITATCVGPRTP